MRGERLPHGEHAMTPDELLAENADLRRRLDEAEETGRAIRDGAVDAFVIQESNGSRIYTLEGADRPYRILIEQMHQGAAALPPLAAPWAMASFHLLSSSLGGGADGAVGVP